jgi:hypothetical protein
MKDPAISESAKSSSDEMRFAVKQSFAIDEIAKRSAEAKTTIK